MRAHVVVTFLLLTSTSATHDKDGLKGNIVEDFIRSSNKTVSIISIDETVEENFAVQESKAFLWFKVESEALSDCEEFARADKYSNVTFPPQIGKFRESKSFKDFVGLWSDSDYDSIIFSSSLYLDAILECFTNPRGVSLIILVDDLVPFSDDDIIVKLNRTWRDNGALNVFLSLRDNIYSFDPFYRNFDGNFGKLNSHSVSYVRPKLTNLNGYAINVEMFASTFVMSSVKNPKDVDDFTGPDANAAEFIRERLNATMTLVANDGAKFGYRNPNGTLTGSLRTLQSRKSDVAFIGYFIKDYETRDVEFSAPIYSDELCIVVKKAGRIPQFILPLIVFDETLWIFLVIETFIGILLWTFLRLMNNRLYRSYDTKEVEFNLPSHMRRRPMILQYVQIFVDFYMLFMGAPMRRFPRAQSERIFIGTVCLLSLNIVTMFQSSLATVFIKPIFYKDIDSLQQFADSRQRIIIKHQAMLADLFPEDSSELFRVLHGRINFVPRPDLEASSLLENGLAAATRKMTFRLSREDNVLHLVEQCPKNYNLAFLLSRHSVYLDKFNSVILDLNQFGFIGKWIEDEYFRVKLENAKSHQAVHVGARVLKLNDLQLHFMLLALGVALSTFVLLFENLLRIKS